MLEESNSYLCIYIMGIFLLFKKKFYCSITVVCIYPSPPPPHPSQTHFPPLLPHPLGFVHLQALQFFLHNGYLLRTWGLGIGPGWGLWLWLPSEHLKISEHLDLESGIHSEEWPLLSLILSANNFHCLLNAEHYLREVEMNS